MLLRDLIVYGADTYTRSLRHTHKPPPPPSMAHLRAATQRHTRHHTAESEIQAIEESEREPLVQRSQNGHGDSGDSNCRFVLGTGQEDDEETVVRTARGGLVRGGASRRAASRSALLARLVGRRAGCVGACADGALDALRALGPGLSIGLLALAVVMVIAQGIGQLGCQLLVFSHISLTTTTSAESLVGRS